MNTREVNVRDADARDADAQGDERSPAIVIFGAAVRVDGRPSTAMRLRVEAAARFGRVLQERGQTPLYIPTGGVGRFDPSEASVMAGLLRYMGVAADRIVLEETATNTISSARACARLLRARGHTGRVYAASSAYHLPRCVVLLRLAGLDARACPPPRQPASTSFRRRWRWRLRELVALPVDTALMLASRLRPPRG